MCNMTRLDTSIYYHIFARDTFYWVCTFILCKMKTTKHEPIFHGLDNDFVSLYEYQKMMYEEIHTKYRVSNSKIL